MYCTGESRYILRDGKKILQQRWVSSFYDPATTQVEIEWRDVTCEDDKRAFYISEIQKAARKRVCNEILDFLNRDDRKGVLMSDYPGSYVENFIKELRDKI